LKVLYVTLIVVVIDQVTKFLVKGLKVEWLGLDIKGMPYGSSKPLIGDLVRLTFIENPGMAFGIDIGPKMFLTIFTIVASLFIFYYIWKHRKDALLLRLSLGLILAGAIGNLIDRTFYGVIYNYAPLFKGKVVDFMQVEFWDFTILGKTYTTWPIWNIADASVSVGFLIILIFHNRIFKQEEPAPVNVINEGETFSPPVDGEYPLDSDHPLDPGDSSIDSTPTPILSEGETFSPPVDGEYPLDEDHPVDAEDNSMDKEIKIEIEDTKENVDPGPGGAGKNKD
jgi:signal peptidase II